MVYETSRLLVRPPKPEDARDIFASYARDPEVVKYLVWKPHRDEAETVAWIDHCMATADTADSRKFVLELKETGTAIGMIDFRIEDYKAEFGYVLARPYWNRGFMTEAMRPPFDSLFADPRIFRIQACHDVDNGASGRVMLKLGMAYEGVLRRYSLHPNISDIPRDVKLYAKVK